MMRVREAVEVGSCGKQYGAQGWEHRLWEADADVAWEAGVWEGGCREDKMTG